MIGKQVKYMLKADQISVEINQNTLLDQVSFTLARGESLCIIGESGSGKTTLLKTLLGIMPMTQGSITHQCGQQATCYQAGRHYLGLPKVSWVMQNPISALNPHLAVTKSVAEGLPLKHLNKQEQARRIAQAFDQVELSSEFMQRKPAQLSIGQAQRVCIARALISNPDIIFFDESLSALDAVVQKQIAKTIDNIKQAHGLSYLFVTHDLGFAHAYADNILLLNAGKVVAYQSVADFFAKPASAYAEQLISAAKILGSLPLDNETMFEFSKVSA